VSKPIFIIRFPFISNHDKSKFEAYYEHVSKQLHDYHVLSLIDNSVNKVEFECYNSPHTEIEFEELKQTVLKTFKVIPSEINQSDISDAIEWDDEDMSDWDCTLMDGLEDEEDFD
jgi:sialic acid synthase SpsE